MKVMFLPGAGGAPGFWEPVARRLPRDWETVLLGWPGLGDQPPDPAVRGLDDLAARVDARIDRPVDLVAQSMGGVVAARLALARTDRVRRLVLVATSAGVDMAGLGAADWRPGYRAAFPRAAAWILEADPGALPVERITAPTLLIWGDADPISPVAVGRHLAERIPDATLHVVAGGDHDLAVRHADAVARLVARHLG